jgi:hypothetical protein
MFSLSTKTSKAAHLSNPTDALAQELWEAHATHHQEVIPMPQLHWDELDPFTQDHWRYIARVAIAFRPTIA